MSADRLDWTQVDTTCLAKCHQTNWKFAFRSQKNIAWGLSGRVEMSADRLDWTQPTLLQNAT